LETRVYKAETTSGSSRFGVNCTIKIKRRTDLSQEQRSTEKEQTLFGTRQTSKP